MSIPINENADYARTTWQNGDLITDNLLNNLQEQLDELVDGIKDIITVAWDSESQLLLSKYNQILITYPENTTPENNDISLISQNEFNSFRNSLIPLYTQGKAYKVNDYVIYGHPGNNQEKNYKLYKCIRAVTEAPSIISTTNWEQQSGIINTIINYIDSMLYQDNRDKAINTPKILTAFNNNQMSFSIASMPRNSYTSTSTPSLFTQLPINLNASAITVEKRSINVAGNVSMVTVRDFNNPVEGYITKYIEGTGIVGQGWQKFSKDNYDIIEGINKNLQNYIGRLPLIWKHGGMYQATGIDYSDTSHAKTDFIEVKPYDEIYFDNIPDSKIVTLFQFKTNTTTTATTNNRITAVTYIDSPRRIILGGTTNYIRLQIRPNNFQDVFDLVVSKRNYKNLEDEKIIQKLTSTELIFNQSYIAGGLSAATGLNDNSDSAKSNRVRSPGWLNKEEISYIQVEEGIQYGIRFYIQKIYNSSDKGYLGYTYWSSSPKIASDLEKLYPEAKYMRIIGRYADNSTINTPQDVGSKIHIYKFKVNELEKKVQEEIDKKYQNVLLEWEYGNYNTAQGKYIENEKTRIRNKLPIQVGDELIISCNNENVQFTLRMMDDNDTLIYIHPDTTTWHSQSTYIVKDKINNKIVESILLSASMAPIGSYTDKDGKIIMDYREINQNDIETIKKAITVKRRGNPKSTIKMEVGAVAVNRIENLTDQIPTPFMSLVGLKYNYRKNDTPIIDGYLYRTNKQPFKFYYAAGTPDNPQYVFEWQKTNENGIITDSDPIDYACLITYEKDILFVFRGDRRNLIEEIPSTGAGHTTDQSRVRKNPIIYQLDENNNYVASVIEFPQGEAPSAWLMNTGFYIEKDKFFIVEYTRPAFNKAYAWKAVKPYNTAQCWEHKLDFDVGYELIRNEQRPTQSTGINWGKSDLESEWKSGGNFKHFHNIDRDPFTGIMYISTGDLNTGAAIFYSIDDGDTWIPLIVGSRKLARQLNFIWTKDAVYWATDDGNIEVHYLLKAKRLANGIIDNNEDHIKELYQWHNTQATYHICYIKNPEGLVLLDRYDSEYNCPLNVLFFDLKQQKMKFAGRFDLTNPPQRAGFRTDVTSDWPNPVDSRIISGFSYWANLLKVCENPGTTTVNPNNERELYLKSDASAVVEDRTNVGKVNNFWIKITK